MLKERTGGDVKAWNRRIKSKRLEDKKSLRAWLTEQGVTGYGQNLLVMEQFGYPDFFLASADELIEAQYADRLHLWPIYQAILAAALKLGEIVIQARKSYVCRPRPGIAWILDFVSMANRRAGGCNAQGFTRR